MGKCFPALRNPKLPSESQSIFKSRAPFSALFNWVTAKGPPLFVRSQVVGRRRAKVSVNKRLHEGFPTIMICWVVFLPGRRSAGSSRGADNCSPGSSKRRALGLSAAKLRLCYRQQRKYWGGLLGIKLIAIIRLKTKRNNQTNQGSVPWNLHKI